MKKRVSVSVSAINPYGYVLNDYVSERDYKCIQIELLRVWIRTESFPSQITLDGIPDRLDSIKGHISGQIGADKLSTFLGKSELFVPDGLFQHTLLPISRFEILRTFSDLAIPHVDINVEDLAQNQQLTQFFRVSVATHDYLATGYSALPAQVTNVLRASPISWDQLDKPSKKADFREIVLTGWGRLIDQCPNSNSDNDYKFTLDYLRKQVFLEKTSAIGQLQDTISRVLRTESEFEPLSNHLLSCVPDASDPDATDAPIRALTQQQFWKYLLFFGGSLGAGSPFLDWDADRKSGATILAVLGIPVLNGDSVEADVETVGPAISASIDRFVSESDSGELTALHTMTSLLAMLKTATSQSPDLAEMIRSVVADSEFGGLTRAREKQSGDDFSQRIFKEFNEFLRPGTHPNEVAGRDSISVHSDCGFSDFATFAAKTFPEIDNSIAGSGQSGFPVTAKQGGDDFSESDSDSTSVHSERNSGELGCQIFADEGRRSVQSGASNRSSRSNSVDYAIDVISESSQLLVQPLLTPPIDNSLDLSPGSSDWWRNLNERIQKLCEKLKEIDSRTHFLEPFLKHESSAVPTKPVSAEVPLRKIRTGVPLKNNGENSGNKNVQSFNNRRRFSRGFFSRLFPRIRV